MRRFGVALALLCWPLFAWSASPTLDCGGVACATGNFQGASVSGTMTLTTTSTNDVVILLLESENACNHTTPHVTSVTDTAGLTWAIFPASGWPHQVNYGASNVCADMDVWYATSIGALTGDVITVTVNAVSDATSFLAFGVNGVASLSAPWDALSCPTYNDAELLAPNTGGIPSATFSTAKPDDLLIALDATAIGNPSGGLAGYTNIATKVNSGGVSNYSQVEADYKSVSSTQTNVTAMYGSFVGTAWQMTVIALTADAGGSSNCATAGAPVTLFTVPW